MHDLIQKLAEMQSTRQLIFAKAKIVCLRHHTSLVAIFEIHVPSTLNSSYTNAIYFPYQKIKIINLIQLELVKLFHDLHFQLLSGPHTFLILLNLLVYALDKFQLPVCLVFLLALKFSLLFDSKFIRFSISKSVLLPKMKLKNLIQYSKNRYNLLILLPPNLFWHIKPSIFLILLVDPIKQVHFYFLLLANFFYYFKNSN